MDGEMLSGRMIEDVKRKSLDDGEGGGGLEGKR